MKKRPKVLLVECVGHSSVVEYLVKVLNPMVETQILFPTGISVDGIVELKSQKPYSFSDKLSLANVLEKLKRDGISHTIIVSAGTMGYLLWPLLEKFAIPFTLLAHNLNFELRARTMYATSGISCLRWLKWTWSPTIRHRLALASRAEGVVVSSENSARLTSELVPNQKIYFSPWAIVPHSATKNRLVEVKRILLLGDISNLRRDFREVISVLKQSKGTSLKFDVVGKPIGQTGQKILKSLSRHSNVTYHGRLNERKLYSLIEEVDAFWLPMTKNLSYLYFQEIAGVSKISGVIHDAIRFDKPVLVNANYEVSSEFLSFAKTYTTAADFIDLTQKPLKYAPCESSVLSKQRSGWGNYLRSVGLKV